MNVQTMPESTQARLAALRLRHRSVDRDIEAEQKRPAPDLGTLQGLKRVKLRLKDEIARYEGLVRTLERGPKHRRRGTPQDA